MVPRLNVFNSQNVIILKKNQDIAYEMDVIDIIKFQVSLSFRLTQMVTTFFHSTKTIVQSPHSRQTVGGFKQIQYLLPKYQSNSIHFPLIGKSVLPKDVYGNFGLYFSLVI